MTEPAVVERYLTEVTTRLPGSARVRSGIVRILLARRAARRAETQAPVTSLGAGVTSAAGPELPHATSAPVSRKLFSARKEFILYAQKLFGITGSAHQQSRQPHAFHRTGSRGTRAQGAGAVTGSARDRRAI
jgi:hypothetical protein